MDCAAVKSTGLPENQRVSAEDRRGSLTSPGGERRIHFLTFWVLRLGGGEQEGLAMKPQISFAIVTGALLCASACGGGSPRPPGGSDGGLAQDTAPPTISWTVTHFQEMKGTQEVTVTAADDVKVQIVELFVVGTNDPVATSQAVPFTLSWNTTATADGLAEIYARATDWAGKSADTPRARILVLNSGRPAQLTDGDSVTLSIPANYDGTQEVDGRSHWNNTSGFHTVIATVDWQLTQGQSPWQLQLAVGQGFCPHDGVVLSEYVTGDTSPMVVTTTREGEFATGRHFVHIKPMLASQHKGESLTYNVKVFLIP
jgi:hypothetical protein